MGSLPSGGRCWPWVGPSILEWKLALASQGWPFLLGVEVGFPHPPSWVNGRQQHKMEKKQPHQKGARREGHPPTGERESAPPPTKVGGVELTCPSSDGVALLRFVLAGGPYLPFMDWTCPSFLGLGLDFPSQSWGWPSSPPLMELGVGLPSIGLRLPFLLLSS